MATENNTIKLHLLEPRATEKTYREQAKRTYAFIVKKSDTKQAIAKLVEKEFNVTVTDVRTLIRDGKKTKFSKGKHAYPGTTYRQDKKIAYVTLKDGDKIKVFEEPEEVKEEKKADKAVKSDAKDSQKADSSRSRAGKKASRLSRGDDELSLRSEDKNAAKENK